MTGRLQDLFDDLPTYLGGHLTLSLSALAVGLIISLPLGILASRKPRFAEWVLGVAGVIQTIPSLALLALMVPVLGGLIGFVPAFLALILYSILPILANTIIGLQGVDPVLKEASRGLGMSDGQMLRRVLLPLAAPVIIAGIRTATVLVVGTATLATPVGEATLGNYIFQGLETRDNLATIFGCVAAALLAVVLDQLIRLLQKSAEKRDRTLAIIALAGLAVVVLGGLYKPVTRLLGRHANRAVVASGPFTEQHILSRVLAARLQDGGFVPYRRPGMGETIMFEALRRSQVDCCVDYSGSVWAILMKRPEPARREDTLRGITEYLRDKHGIECLGSLGFENKYTLAVRADWAAANGLTTISDLARHIRGNRGRPLIIGGDHMIFSRPEWKRLRDLYGLQRGFETIPMDPSLMYEAAALGKVDVITAYSTDGRIKASNLVVLTDDREAFPPYDAVLLVSPRGRERPGLVESLRPLVNAIDEGEMQQANLRVDVDNWSVRQASDELLTRIARTP